MLANGGMKIYNGSLLRAQRSVLLPAGGMKIYTGVCWGHRNLYWLLPGAQISVLLPAGDIEIKRVYFLLSFQEKVMLVYMGDWIEGWRVMEVGES